MSRYRLFLLIACVSMQGCATLSEDECRTADWHAIGYEDGLQGRASVRIADHRKACAKHGVTPDLAGYSQGRDVGLEQYCKPRNGYTLGLKGRRYNGVCPAHAEPEFLHAYKDGKQIYDVKTHIRRLDKILAVNQSELDSLHESLHKKEAELVMQGTTPKRREILLAELRELEDDVAMVQAEILDIEAELRKENNHLVSLQANAGRR